MMLHYPSHTAFLCGGLSGLFAWLIFMESVYYDYDLTKL